MIIEKVLYHFISSSVVGFVVYWLISSMESQSSQEDQRGYINLMFSHRLLLPLLFAVWSHTLVFDIIEHGSLPKIAQGIHGLVAYLISLI